MYREIKEHEFIKHGIDLEKIMKIKDPGLRQFALSRACKKMVNTVQKAQRDVIVEPFRESLIQGKRARAIQISLPPPKIEKADQVRISLQPQSFPKDDINF